MTKKKHEHENMLVAFFLNLGFTIIELIGGVLTNSVSIIGDAIHDFGDALSIGISLILDRISKKKPDLNYTYGYLRYSILGALINLSVLIIGSIFVLNSSIGRLFNPQEVSYTGMFFLSILGIIMNGYAVFKTYKNSGINDKVINIHLLEDVLGWVLIFFGSILIKFTNLTIIDPILSIIISIFIIFNVFKAGRRILDIFLEKVPHDIDILKIRKKVMEVSGVIDIHHIHIWSMDGINNYLTAHIETNNKLNEDKIIAMKQEIKHVLSHYKIKHTTLEVEASMEVCDEKTCDVEVSTLHHHH